METFVSCARSVDFRKEVHMPQAQDAHPQAAAMVQVRPEASALAQPMTQSAFMPSQETLKTLLQIAHSVANAGFYDCKGVDDAMLRLLKGWELGVPPMSALAGIFIIDGKPSYLAQFLQGLAMRDPAVEMFECHEESDTRVVYAIKRREWSKAQLVTWTIEDAQRMGLLDKGRDEAARKANNWNRMPRVMLHARCKSEGARRVSPGSLFGMYSVEELRDTVVEAQEAPPPPQLSQAAPTSALADEFVARVQKARTKVERKALRVEIEKAMTAGQLAGAELVRVQEAYNIAARQEVERAQTEPPSQGAAGGPPAPDHGVGA